MARLDPWTCIGPCSVRPVCTRCGLVAEGTGANHPEAPTYLGYLANFEIGLWKDHQFSNSTRISPTSGLSFSHSTAASLQSRCQLQILGWHQVMSSWGDLWGGEAEIGGQAHANSQQVVSGGRSPTGATPGKNQGMSRNLCCKSFIAPCRFRCFPLGSAVCAVCAQPPLFTVTSNRKARRRAETAPAPASPAQPRSSRLTSTCSSSTTSISRLPHSSYVVYIPLRRR